LIGDHNIYSILLLLLLQLLLLNYGGQKYLMPKLQFTWRLYWLLAIDMCCLFVESWNLAG